MKQDAFIQRLRQALDNLSKPEVDEIVADYREYIGDAIAAGRNEEDVIAALGDPDKLAREFKAQATYRQWQARRSFGNLARVVVSIAGLGLLNVILLVPFMVYLLLLTVGYIVSGTFAIGGLIAVVAIGSHHLFGWPRSHTTPVQISAQAGHSASPGAGPDEVQLERDAHGDTKRLAVKRGKESVVIEAGKGISITDADSDVHIVAPIGKPLAGRAFGYALAMLVGGVLGLAVCLWLTRATWRGLSRYVHRQIDTLSGRFDEQGTLTSPSSVRAR